MFSNNISFFFQSTVNKVMIIMGAWAAWVRELCELNESRGFIKFLAQVQTKVSNCAKGCS